MTRIRVILPDGSDQAVPYYVLEHLIRKNLIVAFEREDGMVLIHKGPIRKRGNGASYQGAMRRISDSVEKKRKTDYADLSIFTKHPGACE